MSGVDPATPGLVADWTFDNASLTNAASGLTGTLVADVHLAGDNATPTPTPTATAVSSLTPTPSPTPIESATPTPSPTASPLTPVPGDVNCDGHVTVPDGSFLLADLAIFKQVAGLTQLPTSCQAG